MNNSLKPAIIGGLVAGVLSALPMVNTCCCLWGLVGGALAVMLAVKESATPLQMGDGVKLGAIAGVIATVLYLVIGVPLALITGRASMSAMSGYLEQMNPEMAEQIRQQTAAMQSASMVEQITMMIPSILLIAAILVITGILGGVLGVPLFEKRKGGAAGVPPPPPPPPAYGGTGV
ncbi:MAG TPA: hypothetical protein VER32_00515 [Pyrinomonadaceae bacterium]|nr:hypothetical protein [Pyrinomonadaceae bacterium]